MSRVHLAAVREFVATWRGYCEDPRILTDQPNECGLDNFPDFQDRRGRVPLQQLAARLDPPRSNANAVACYQLHLEEEGDRYHLIILRGATSMRDQQMVIGALFPMLQPGGHLLVENMETARTGRRIARAALACSGVGGNGLNLRLL